MTLAERVLALVRELEHQHTVWQAVANDVRQSQYARDRAADLARVNRMHARWLRVVLDPNPEPLEAEEEAAAQFHFGGPAWHKLLASLYSEPPEDS